MGVAGAGKTTVGRILARDLGWTFLDADDYHSPASVEKMRHGIPLTDADRAAWLDRLHAAIHELDRRRISAIIACSALREAYRRRLSEGEPDVRFVYLRGTPELIGERLRHRTGHYMPASLLESQFETLEEPAGAVTIDVTQPPDAIARRIEELLGLDPARAARRSGAPGADGLA